MKPNFALTLSHDGIGLLHRQKRGWRVVGQVPLDDAQFGEKLGELRKSAKALQKGDVIAKLVIPSSQIIYKIIKPAELTDQNRDIQIRAALEGATPYEVDDLAYDSCKIDDDIHIAAVARQTLDEAENFATENGFTPVSFVTIPEDGQFKGEPFFGVTVVAGTLLKADDTLQKDRGPIRVYGAVKDASTNDEPVAETSQQDAPKISVTSAIVPSFEEENQNKVTELKATPAQNPAVTQAALPKEPTVKAPAPEPDKPAQKPKQPLAASVPFINAAIPKPTSEEQAMTVFGARKATKKAVGAKPRHLGLIVMLSLIAAIIGVAMWFTLSGDKSTNIEADNATVFSNPKTPPVTALPTPPQTPTAPAPNSVDDALAALDAPTIRHQPTPQPAPSTQQNPHADSDIWQIAPIGPAAPRADGDDTLYVASVDRKVSFLDAVALPGPADITDDHLLAAQSAPANHNARFVLDDRGLVIPSLDGTLNPDGILVFAGPPSSKPGERGKRVPQVLNAPNLHLSGYRPTRRPKDLSSQIQDAEPVDFAAFRPKPRPANLQGPPPSKAEAERDETPTAQAVLQSLAPSHRPRNMAAIIKTARAVQRKRALATTTLPRTQPSGPQIPTRASVARMATTKNAIKLRRTSLIGIYGSVGKRRALVRLRNGRYVKVAVGQRVDGGKVAAIGVSELRYVKAGRTILLQMPKR